jgi:hypothetical protein
MSAHNPFAHELPPFGWDAASSAGQPIAVHVDLAPNVVDVSAIVASSGAFVDGLAPDVRASLQSAHSRLVGILAAMDALLITPSGPLFRTLALNVDELLELGAGEFSDAMTAAGLRLR